LEAYPIPEKSVCKGVEGKVLSNGPACGYCLSNRGITYMASYYAWLRPIKEGDNLAYPVRLKGEYMVRPMDTKEANHEDYHEERKE
jgi:hypothetical protein